MLEDIVYALESAGRLVHIYSLHLSNHAVDSVLPTDKRRLIGNSWEDGNISSIENAKATANIISTIMSNKWVLIDTGDYIMSNCGNYDNETYDPNYCYYLVSTNIFSQYATRLLDADIRWRKEKQDLANLPAN